MTKYMNSTKDRVSFPDKSLFMSAYIKMGTDFPDDKEIEVKKNTLNDLSYIVADVLHRDVETEVSVREGSLIAEVISSGDLHTLLSPENIKAIGVQIKENDLVKGILGYAVLRAAVNTLSKDIKRATSTLSMVARSVFGARLGDVLRLEARTGVIGSLQRFLDACDVARGEKISVKQRKNAMKRAYEQLEAMNKITEKSQDREMVGIYVNRELERIKSIDNYSEDDEKDAKEFNNALSKSHEIDW